MRILLDENLPEPLISALKDLGHQVDSVGRLGLKGTLDFDLYRGIGQGYDVFFTRDASFARAVARTSGGGPPKLLHVTLSQSKGPQFVVRFLSAFTSSDPALYGNGADWP